MEFCKYTTAGRRLMLLCEGSLDSNTAKTAVGLLAWCPQDVVAIVDSTQAGGDPEALIGFGRGVPIVASVGEAVALGANQVIVGVANPGGVLVPGFRERIIEALAAGCDVVSGLHEILSDDHELAALATEHHATIYDVRLVPDVPVGTNRARALPNRRVLTVGSDCNVGKMMTTLAMVRLLTERGEDARFIATGQTGIMISGAGYCIDRAISDFASGIAERMILDEADHRWLMVEGQGSIDHPSYSGVTLSLLHGTAPQALVLCHVASRAGRRHDEGSPLLPLPEYVRLYETIAEPIQPARVLGVSLNTRDLPEAEARDAVRRAEDATGLPATDPIRFGAEPLVDALQTHFLRADAR